MKKPIHFYFKPSLNLLLLLLLFSACQDPITLGDDLLDEDQVNIGFTDTIAVRSRTVIGDSVRTYAPQLSNQLRSYLFGDFRDPVFGQAKSTVYAQVRPERFNPDFSNASLDSIVLVLPYDTAGIYGKTEGERFGIEVFRLTEDIDRNAEYFSGQTFATEPVPIGRLDFTPTLDSIAVIEYVSATVTDTVRFPHLRIHLDQQLGEEILKLDTAIIQSDTAWLEYFKGINLNPTLPTPGMLSFALNTQPYLGGIYLYYTQDDTAKRQFHFEIDEFSARLASYQHDYDNTQLSDFIGDFALGDSLVFAQGMVGLNVEIELQNLEEFENIIVNKAELLVNLHPLSNVDTLYPPARQFLLSARNDDGAQLVISDVELAAQSPSGLAGAFGGVLNKEDGTFTMNISAHFQQIIEGNAGKTLTLTVFPKADSPDRIILYGAGNPEKKILIRLAFTKL